MTNIINKYSSSFADILISNRDYVFPHNLFDSDISDESLNWICVRSRPRWEKKIARCLHANGISYYLPTISKTINSGRKKRISSLPLFPGYLFLASGINNTLPCFDKGSILYTIKPKTHKERIELDCEIKEVWKLLANNAFVRLQTEYQAGDKVIITSGPMCGIKGKVICIDKSRKLLVWVDMLGVGASVLLHPSTSLKRIDIS